MISKPDQSRWQKVAFLCAICLHIYHILTDDYREITAILSFINRWTTYCKSLNTIMCDLNLSVMPVLERIMKHKCFYSSPNGVRVQIALSAINN